MNHKRGRPKNRRRGCITCKPHKMNGMVKTYHLRGLKGKTDRNELKQMTSESEARPEPMVPRT
jgi:hypothetical protein